MLRQIIITTLLLGLFAVIGTAMVGVTFTGTGERIALNERATLLHSIDTLIPASEHDNDIVSDTLEIISPQWLGTRKPVTVYRARRQGQPVAVVLTPIAPDGYSGDIRLLVGIRYDGTLAGVRVLAHKETPGLGDYIEETRADWILQFSGLSLTNPPDEQWKVKRDGGHFDQFTGATITPRAVVNAVHRALVYFQEHREALFAPSPSIAESPTTGAPTTGAPTAGTTP